MFKKLWLGFKTWVREEKLREADVKLALAMCGVRFYNCPHCGKELTERELKYGLGDTNTGPR